MLHNKRRKSKGEKRVDFKDLHARNAATNRTSIDRGERLFLIHFPVVICHFSFGVRRLDAALAWNTHTREQSGVKPPHSKNKKGRPQRPSLDARDKRSLVSLLSNESRDVEIVNAWGSHHRPREIVGRPRYETWRWRGNRCCRSGRRN